MEDKLKKLEDEGYDFLLDWTMDDPIVPERVMTPSGLILSIEEIEEALGTTNSDHIKGELKRAIEFYDLVMGLGADQRTSRYPASFVGKDDLENCKGRYESAL